MALWLFKEEPTNYSFADLIRDGETVWSGISNALALQHLRRCAAGDFVFFYHTGKVKAIVGIMEIVRGHPPEVAKDQEVTVTVRPVAAMPCPVTLAQIKADKVFKDWDLVRNSRLSVMPVTKAQWKRIEVLAAEPDE